MEDSQKWEETYRTWEDIVGYHLYSCSIVFGCCSASFLQRAWKQKKKEHIEEVGVLFASLIRSETVRSYKT